MQHDEAGPTATRPRRPFASIENWIVAIALLAMVIIPLAEIVLRATLQTGISGSASVVQHLTLIVGMLGAAIAAREKRLLSLSTTTFLKGRIRSAAEVFASGFSAAIAVFLAIASIQFLEIERESGAILVYGIPLWVVQLALPVGFGLIALRLIWHAGTAPSSSAEIAIDEEQRALPPRTAWLMRATAAAIAAVVVAVGIHPFTTPANLLWPGLVTLLIAVVLGAPVFAALAGAALILFWAADSPIASISLDHYSLVTNPSLPTIPLFTLAGYFLAESGAAHRLVRVFQTLVGWFRGGPAIVTALVCAFFTSFTGASGVTILALGGLLMPVLLGAKYSEKSALGLLTGAGSLGLLLPPCLPLILYAIVAQVTIQEMFLGGVLPGMLLIALTAWWGVRQGPRIAKKDHRFQPREAAAAIWAAKWELLLPVVALVALFSGYATPVEAAALTALYALFVEAVLHRDYKTPASIAKVVVECGLLVGGVLLILGVALGFTNYLIDAQIPPKLVDWTTSSIQSPLAFLLALNVFLLIVGCLMDVFSAIVVVVPLIVPIGMAFNIHPIHLGIIFLANLELGYLTPPVGMNLFLASYRFRKPLPEVYRAAFPMLLVLLVGVLVITYVPWLTTWLPSVFASGSP
jgi:tripartite ATP-independent transporter DctM subunit